MKKIIYLFLKPVIAPIANCVLNFFGIFVILETVAPLETMFI